MTKRTTKSQRDEAYELVERELMAAGVTIISFKHIPKGGECAVGSWYNGGPLRPGTIKWVADNCRPRDRKTETPRGGSASRARADEVSPPSRPLQRATGDKSMYEESTPDYERRVFALMTAGQKAATTKRLKRVHMPGETVLDILRSMCQRFGINAPHLKEWQSHGHKPAVGKKGKPRLSPKEVALIRAMPEPEPEPEVKTPSKQASRKQAARKAKADKTPPFAELREAAAAVVAEAPVPTLNELVEKSEPRTRPTLEELRAELQRKNAEKKAQPRRRAKG